MFPLYFHYEDVSRQDPLLKLNHANVMEVPGLCKIRVVPKAAPSIKNGKLAMEIPCGQKCLQTQRSSTGRSFRSNPFLGSNKDKKGYVSDLARQSTLRVFFLGNLSAKQMYFLPVAKEKPQGIVRLVLGPAYHTGVLVESVLWFSSLVKFEVTASFPIR